MTSLRRAFLLAVALACGCLPKLALAQSQAEQQLFDLVNHERENAGLLKLQWDNHLAEAARAHSALMAENQDLSHQFAGEPPLQQRARATGARFDAWGENVAAAPAVEVVHKGLMKSPGHRANILNSLYNSVGIAIVERGHELYVTQDFSHIPRVYNEAQLRKALVELFDDARRVKGIAAIDVAVDDPHLRKAACSEGHRAEKLLQKLPGGTNLVVFTLSEPGKLPDNMQKAAADTTLQRMSIGVCLIGGAKDGFSKFRVVAVFYPVN